MLRSKKFKRETFDDNNIEHIDSAPEYGYERAWEEKYSWEHQELISSNRAQSYERTILRLNAWFEKGRIRPYTVAQIEKKVCVRCGRKGEHQWQICADNRYYRVMCIKCDIKLNEMVLKWARDPNWKEKIKKYKESF